MPEPSLFRVKSVQPGARGQSVTWVRAWTREQATKFVDLRIPHQVVKSCLESEPRHNDPEIHDLTARHRYTSETAAERASQ